MKLKDKITIAFLSLFVVVAWTIELFWFIQHNNIQHMSGFIPRAFSLYGRGDNTWFSVDKSPPFALSFMLMLEGIHIFISQLLNLLLIRAIVKSKAYRYKLQLLVSSYVFYSVLVYYGVHWVSGFSCMAVKDWVSYVVFFGFNAPYLLAYLWTGIDAWKNIGVSNEHTKESV